MKLSGDVQSISFFNVFLCKFLIYWVLAGLVHPKRSYYYMHEPYILAKCSVEDNNMSEFLNLYSMVLTKKS